MPHTFHTEQTELQTCNAKLNGGDRKSYIASPRNLLLSRHQTAEKSNHALDKIPETDIQKTSAEYSAGDKCARCGLVLHWSESFIQ